MGAARPEISRVAGKIPFLRDVVAAYFCAFDPDTPRHVRMMLMAALAYFVVPLDMLPDFIAGFGFTDDAAVLAAVLRTLSNHITEAHRSAADKALAKLGLGLGSDAESS